uniref:Interleukin-2,Interleukin-2 receptor subunit alpha n=2 Tax=Homo sapiens TaxID=9606 RepID=UPI0014612D5B|nr:Chain A, Interleukin-2,Interleukin-2 receptor subunit alpha [Homo sapiens]
SKNFHLRPRDLISNINVIVLELKGSETTFMCEYADETATIVEFLNRWITFSQSIISTLTGGSSSTKKTQLQLEHLLLDLQMILNGINNYKNPKLTRMLTFKFYMPKKATELKHLQCLEEELKPLEEVLNLAQGSGGGSELCDDDPPEIPHATFKAMAYKEGTMLNCECKRGFRRIKSGSLYMLCTGNSSHSSWDNQCQCTSSATRNTTKQVTPQPEEQKERKTTEMQSPMQPVDQASLPGHCREPPPWENEATERIYHFVVGQMVYYQCVQGYRALHRGPAESVCKMTHGKTRWTQPQLICTG